MAIKPIGDRILVEVLEEEEKRVGSLYVPDTAKEKPNQGKVIAVGEGVRNGDEITPLSVKEGDRVLFGKFAGMEIEYDGKAYLILQESDVLAVIE